MTKLTKDLILEAVKNQNIDFFKNPISNYDEIEINDVSILSYLLIYSTTMRDKNLIDNDLKIVQKLLNNNRIDLNKEETDGFTPILYIVDSELTLEQKLDLVKKFVTKGADLTYVTSVGQSFTLFCISNYQIPLLLQSLELYVKEQIKEELLPYLSDIYERSIEINYPEGLTFLKTYFPDFINKITLK